MENAGRLLTVVCTTALVVGCGSSAASAPPAPSVPSDKPVVAAAFYPIADIVENVAGDTVELVTLVPPGEEAHEYEPSARQITELHKASVVFYLGGAFQPAVERALVGLPASTQKVDLLANLDLLPVTGALSGTDGEIEAEVLKNGADPHVWLDPANMIEMATVVADALHRDASTYLTELNQLDEAYRQTLAHCRSSAIVTSHRAFEYMSHAYGLKQIPIAGISPDEEPSAKTLQAVAAAAKANDVTTIFFEENLPPDLSKTVADEIGATTAVLDALESLSRDQLDAHSNYVSVMTANLATLKTALGCS